MLEYSPSLFSRTPLKNWKPGEIDFCVVRENNEDLYVHLVIFHLSDRVLCADQRGYWGDYDDLHALGPVPGREGNVFARTYTDSQPSCAYRWLYTSSPVHVGFTGN